MDLIFSQTVIKDIALVESVPRGRQILGMNE